MKLLQNILLDNEDEVLEGSYPIGTVFIISSTNGKFRVVKHMEVSATVRNTTMKKMIVDGIVIADTSAGSAETGSTIAAKLYAEPNTNQFGDAFKAKLAGLKIPDAAEIAALYESLLNTNKFTNLEKDQLAKLAKAPVSEAEVKKLYEDNPDTNALTNALKKKLEDIKEINVVDFIKLYRLTNLAFFTQTYKTKLDTLVIPTPDYIAGIYERFSDVKRFSTHYKDKLDGITALAKPYTGLDIKNMLASNPDTHTLTDIQLSMVLAAIPNTEKGVKNGVATLDNVGKVPQSQLPGVNLGNTYAVKTQAEMLAWPSHHIEDVFIIADDHKTFVHASGLGNTLADYLEILSPPGTVSSVNAKYGDIQLTTNDIPEFVNKNYVSDDEKDSLKHVVTTNDKHPFIETMSVGNGTPGKKALVNIVSMDGSEIIMEIGRHKANSNEVGISAKNNILFKIPANKKLIVETPAGSKNIQLEGTHTDGDSFPGNPVRGDTFTPVHSDRLFEYNGHDWVTGTYNYIYSEIEDRSVLKLMQKGDSCMQIHSTTGEILERAIYNGTAWINDSHITVSDSPSMPSRKATPGDIHLIPASSGYGGEWVYSTAKSWVRSPGIFIGNSSTTGIAAGEEVEGDITVNKDSFAMNIYESGQWNKIGGASSGGLIGEIKMWSSMTAPADHLLLDGNTFDQNTYPELFTVLGNNKLPNLRGQFVRGARTASEATGKSSIPHSTALPRNGFSTGNTPNHTHDMWQAMGRDDADGDGSSQNGGGFGGGSASFHKHQYTNSGGAHSHNVIGGDNETAPDHVCLSYIIRAK